MPSSDIYQIKESPEAKKKEAQPTSQRRRSSSESFDEVVNKDLSKTNRRRYKNSGVRRFRHLMKKPEFSKKFWTITLSVSGLFLLLLVIWDFFFRYPDPAAEYSGDAYEFIEE